jgi:hypothetical protein
VSRTHRLRLNQVYQLDAPRSACHDAAAWPKPLKPAVNLSAVQFMTGDLCATVLMALVASGLPPHRLEQEITETLLVDENGASPARPWITGAFFEPVSERALDPGLFELGLLPGRVPDVCLAIAVPHPVQFPARRTP